MVGDLSFQLTGVSYSNFCVTNFIIYDHLGVKSIFVSVIKPTSHERVVGVHNHLYIEGMVIITEYPKTNPLSCGD